VSVASITSLVEAENRQCFLIFPRYLPLRRRIHRILFQDPTHPSRSPYSHPIRSPFTLARATRRSVSRAESTQSLHGRTGDRFEFSAEIHKSKGYEYG